MIEVVVTIGAVRHTKFESDRQHQQTNWTQLFTNRLDVVSVGQPTASEHWGKSITFYELAHPSWPGDLQRCLWLLKAPGYVGWGRCQVSSAAQCVLWGC